VIVIESRLTSLNVLFSVDDHEHENGTQI